jgi:hypothetical protein
VRSTGTPGRSERSSERERSSRTVAAWRPLQKLRTIARPQKSSGPIDCANTIVGLPARIAERITPL